MVLRAFVALPAFFAAFCSEASFFTPCENTFIATAPAANGAQIEVWERSCGATSGFATYLVASGYLSDKPVLPEEAFIGAEVAPWNIVLEVGDDDRLRVSLDEEGAFFFLCEPPNTDAHTFEIECVGPQKSPSD